jgi:hypothetical protein
LNAVLAIVALAAIGAALWNLHSAVAGCKSQVI